MLKKSDKDTLHILETEEKQLWKRLDEIRLEKMKIQAKDKIDYTGKLLCIIDTRETWQGETWILVKSQGEPEPNGAFHVSGPCVTIIRDLVTGNPESAQFLKPEHGGAWISKNLKIREVTKDEVIKVTSQLGFDYWNDKL